jgi:hypothetical protein
MEDDYNEREEQNKEKKTEKDDLNGARILLRN